MRTSLGATTTEQVWSGWDILEERNASSGALLREHVTGLGLDDHVQMRDAATGQRFYFHGNLLGSVGLLTRSDGVPVETYTYSWLGRPEVRTIGGVGGPLDRSSVGNPYLFHGREWFPELQLYAWRHRWYSPSIGEYITIDPLGIWAHGVGTGYEAFAGNPWSVGDPMGLAPPVGLAPLVPTAAELAASTALWEAAMAGGAVKTVTAAGLGAGGAVAAAVGVGAFAWWAVLDADASIGVMAMSPLPGNENAMPLWGPTSRPPRTLGEWADFKTNRGDWEALALDWWGVSPTAPGGAGGGDACDPGQTARVTTEVGQGLGRAAKRGTPNSIYEQLGDAGRVRSRTFYDENGHPFSRQDFDHAHGGLQPHETTRTFDAEGRPITTEVTGPLPPGYDDTPTVQ